MLALSENDSVKAVSHFTTYQNDAESEINNIILYYSYVNLGSKKFDLLQNNKNYIWVPEVGKETIKSGWKKVFGEM